MTPLSELLQQGSGHAWLFIPSAILLGALHGLEPGHSKTMMAAFIVAIRGTVSQAVLLGLSATASHTAVVWVVALTGMYFFGGKLDAESTEPYFQLASAVLIIGIALWMLYRNWKEQQKERQQAAHTHGDHGGHDEVREIDIGHGILRLEIFEQGQPPRFRVQLPPRKLILKAQPVTVSVETERAGGARQTFTFVDRGGFLESVEDIPEPHEFLVRLTYGHEGHAHNYDVEFVEHGHAHALPGFGGIDVTAPGYQDAHELAHANDIRRRFSTRQVTTGQIVMFGLTGGLIPCPGSITVLLLCLQLKQIALGVTLVLCFSVGLALTMVLAGTVAALGVREASKRVSGFGLIARRAPYVSSAIIILVGIYTGYVGYTGLAL